MKVSLKNGDISTVSSEEIEAYKKYVTENEKVPDSEADEHIIDAVLDKINEEQIWIPSGEIVSYYHRKKPHLQKRLDNEKNIKFKQYVSFYKSIVDQDRCAVVICDLNHEIIYMNPAAVLNYEKWGGEKLIGRSLMECHNQASREKIQNVMIQRKQNASSRSVALNISLLI